MISYGNSIPDPSLMRRAKVESKKIRPARLYQPGIFSFFSNSFASSRYNAGLGRSGWEHFRRGFD